jgi:hypothetical protein
MISLFKKEFQIVQLFEIEKIANLFSLKLKSIGFKNHIEKKDYYYFVISDKIDKNLLEKAKKVVLLYCKIERKMKQRASAQ